MMAKPSIDDLLLRYSRLAERRRRGMAGGALALVVVAYGLGVFWEQAQRTDGLASQLQTAETTRAEKGAYAANLSRYQARLGQLSEQLQLARAMLPDDPDVPQFLAHLGARAHEVGLSIERFEPQGEIFHDFFSELRFVVQVRGTYHQLGNLLDQLGKMDRIVNIGELSLSDPKFVAHHVQLTGAFVLRIYRSLSAEQQKAAQEAKKKAKTP